MQMHFLTQRFVVGHAARGDISVEILAPRSAPFEILVHRERLRAQIVRAVEDLDGRREARARECTHDALVLGNEEHAPHVEEHSFGRRHPRKPTGQRRCGWYRCASWSFAGSTPCPPMRSHKSMR